MAATDSGQGKVRLIDTSLREGEQSPGVVFDLAVKKKIIQSLTELGIDEIELGIACAEIPDIGVLADFIRSRYPRQHFSLWCRCLPADILFGASLSPTCLSLSIPASDLHLGKKLGKSRKWAVRTLRSAIDIAQGAGVARVSVGLEDASRADPEFIAELAAVAMEAGAFRLRLADTVGVATPAGITAMLAPLSDTDLELGVHCHNDFGMATANTITAFEQGALWGDVTILGLGERAGNSRLEEVLAYLVLRQQRDDYSLDGLLDVSRQLAAYIKQPLSPSRPIIGDGIFTCETGIHLQGLLADPATYEPFDPDRIGAKRQLLMGAKTGKHGVLAALKRLGESPPEPALLTRLTREVRSLAAGRSCFLGDRELAMLLANQ